MALDNPEDESEGYLLEKSLKDSLLDLQVSVLGLLKLGQVGPGAGGAPAEGEGSAATATAATAATVEAGEKPAN